MPRARYRLKYLSAAPTWSSPRWGSRRRSRCLGSGRTAPSPQEIGSRSCGQRKVCSQPFANCQRKHEQTSPDGTSTHEQQQCARLTRGRVRHVVRGTDDGTRRRALRPPLSHHDTTRLETQNAIRSRRPKEGSTVVCRRATLSRRKRTLQSRRAMRDGRAHHHPPR